MTLNGVIAFILRYFTEFDGLGSRLRHGAEYLLQVIFWPTLTHSAVTRSLCDRQLLVNCVFNSDSVISS